LLHFLQKLFNPGKSSASGGWQAVCLTPPQARRHARWVEQQVFLNWLGPYFKAYHLLKGGAGGLRGLRVQLVADSGRQGALLFYDPSIGPGNFRHFYEHIGERLLNLGYHRACADQFSRRERGHTQATLKQLFKPNPTDCPRTGQCNQRYGLVTVDLVQMNGTPLFIRLTSNAVLQPGFTPAVAFDELMQALFHAPMPPPEIEALVGDYYAVF
jgi:hypothetical protein